MCDLQVQYQKLYKTTEYGQSLNGDYPFVLNCLNRNMYTMEPVIDLGCGRGDFVIWLNSRGVIATGVDWVSLYNGMEIADITNRIDMSYYNTATCLNVLEHFDSKGVAGILDNMSKVSHQIIIISEHADNHMHKNIKSIPEWPEYISEYLDIVDYLLLDNFTNRYLIMAKQKS